MPKSKPSVTQDPRSSPAGLSPAKQQYCSGCRNDFYNHGNHSTSGQCWSLKTAKVVTRFRLHWWTAPTVPGAFTEIRTLDCHHAPGKYAHYDELPTFAVNPHRLAEAIR